MWSEWGTQAKITNHSFSIQTVENMRHLLFPIIIFLGSLYSLSKYLSLVWKGMLLLTGMHMTWPDTFTTSCSEGRNSLLFSSCLRYLQSLESILYLSSEKSFSGGWCLYFLSSHPAMPATPKRFAMTQGKIGQGL